MEIQSTCPNQFLVSITLCLVEGGKGEMHLKAAIRAKQRLLNQLACAFTFGHDALWHQQHGILQVWPCHHILFSKFHFIRM